MTPWTVALEAPLSMGFSRREYTSELPFPSSGDLPDPGIKPMTPALEGRFFAAVTLEDLLLSMSLMCIIRLLKAQSEVTASDLAKYRFHFHYQ